MEDEKIDRALALEILYQLQHADQHIRKNIGSRNRARTEAIRRLNEALFGKEN